MNVDDIKKITVVGSGSMGSQIAMVCALAGYTVTLQDIDNESLEKAKRSLIGHMENRVKKGRLSQDEVNDAFDRLNFESSLEAAVKGTDFVIEAIIELLDEKRKLFSQLDQLTDEHVIFATNSSTFSSSKLADATNRPEKVCNMHFFNPALVMELVEVVQGPHTSEETAKITVDLSKRINKTPILLKKEIDGFVANRILAALTNEAISLYEKGIASFEDIDLACTKALNHPIGPFALLDLTGIDIGYYVGMQRYEKTKNEADKPPKTIIEKFEKGELGRKTGKGFYVYD